MGTTAKPIPVETGGGSSMQDPRVADLSADQYNELVREYVQSGVTNDTTARPDASAVSRARPGTTPQPQSPPNAPQVPGFWHRLLTATANLIGNPATNPNTAEEYGKLGSSAMRGLAEAGNNVGKTAAELAGTAGAFIARHTGIGEAITPGYNAAYDQAGGAHALIQDEDLNVVSPGALDATYGVPDGDPLASLTENISQVIGGLAFARGLGIKGGIKQGMFVDFAAFDPYQAQLAELAAKAPKWTGIGLIGDLLSVKGDDSWLVARIKRSAAGALAGKFIDGLIASARLVRSARVLSDPASTAAEKSAAQETASQAEQTVQAVADGTHNDPSEVVSVKPTPDGQYTLGLNQNADFFDKIYGPEKAARARQLRELENQARDLSIRKPRTPEELARLKELRRAITEDFTDLEPPPMPERPPSNAPPRQTQSVMPPTKNWRDMTTQELIQTFHSGDAASPESMTFPTQGQAEATAATMNDGISARLNRFSGTLSTEDVAAVRQLAQTFATSKDPAVLDRMMEGTHFNGSYMNDPREGMAYIEALSERFQKELDAAQATVPIENMLGAARTLMGAMPEGEAPVIMRQVLQNGNNQGWGVKSLVAREVLKRSAKKLYDMSSLIWMRPNDGVLLGEFQNALSNTYGLQEELARAYSEWGRTGRFMQEGNNPALRDMPFGTAETKTPTAAAQKPMSELVAGMKPSELQAQARMIRLGGGDPKNLFALRAAAKVIRLRSLRQIGTDLVTGAIPRGHAVRELGDKVLRSAVEVYRNFLLSGPSTLSKAIVPSQSLVSGFEAVSRLAAGVITRNSPLAREGADQLFGLFHYLKDNIASVNARIEAGMSVIDPRPQVLAIGGRTGELVRTPGAAVGALDEGSTVANYRAIVRAKSLRMARAEGLTGPALENRVANDLRNAFDSEGRATLPDALARAHIPSFNGPLPPGSLGDAFINFVNQHPALQFIVPFPKVGFKIFDYAWQSTPVLNMLNREARQTILRGGEEAAVLHAKTAIAGTIYGYAFMQALQGNLTGRGPTNPALRAQWLATHKPYSLQITDNITGKSAWHSYARAEPFATFLGIIGDLHQIVSESPQSRDATDLAAAVLASFVSDISGKTYLAGVTQFADAWGSGDSNTLQRYLNRFGANMLVPNFVTDVGRTTGLNPYWHETRSLADAILDRLPSNAMPTSMRPVPKYDYLGRPELRMLEPGSVPKNNVEDALLGMGKALTPFPTRLMNGLVDLTDRSLAGKGQDVPYVRLMNLVRDGFGGTPGLRNQMVQLVNSARWRNASDGSELFPGGARWLMANAIKVGTEHRAFAQVLREYPKLRNLYTATLHARGASILRGDDGIADVQRQYNVLLGRH